MEKKPDRWNKPSMPAFTTAIHPEQLAIHMVPENAAGAMPAARILEARSSVVKEHFEHDMERLRQTLAPGRVEPRLSLSAPAADLHLQMRENIDPRSGQLIATKAMAKDVPVPAQLQLRPDHPMHPENQLPIFGRKSRKWGTAFDDSNAVVLLR